MVGGEGSKGRVQSMSLFGLSKGPAKVTVTGVGVGGGELFGELFRYC